MAKNNISANNISINSNTAPAYHPVGQSKR